MVVEGCVPSRCVGVSAGSWISLLCRGLPVGAMWTECRQTCSVSCSHALPCWMVLAAGMPVAGFRWIARARSKATERKGTAWCNPVYVNFPFSFVLHWRKAACVMFSRPLYRTQCGNAFIDFTGKRMFFFFHRMDICVINTLAITALEDLTLMFKVQGCTCCSF